MLTIFSHPQTKVLLMNPNQTANYLFKVIKIIVKSTICPEVIEQNVVRLQEVHSHMIKMGSLRLKST